MKLEGNMMTKPKIKLGFTDYYQTLDEFFLDTLSVTFDIQRDDVDSIFTLDEFARIFDEETLTHITTQNTPEQFEHFLAPSYQQTEAPYVCYFHNQDYRNLSLPRYQEQGGETSHLKR